MADENSVAELDAEAVVQQLAEIVQSMSPVQLAEAGIIVKKVTSTTNDFKKFGLTFRDSTTVVVEISLHYEEPEPEIEFDLSSPSGDQVKG